MKKIGLVLFILSFWTFIYAQDETVTLVTYYPAPYGIYDALKVGTTEADVAGITAPLQVGGASPVDTSIYAEQNGGGGAAASYAGYFHGGATGCIRLSSSGTIDRTHSGNGGLVIQNTDNPGQSNWKITRSSSYLYFHYGDNAQIYLTNGNHIHIPNGGITLEWTAPEALPNWEIARSFGNLMFYYGAEQLHFTDSGDIFLNDNKLDGSGFYIAHNGNNRMRVWNTYLRPTNNNSYDLGTTDYRFRTIYCHSVDKTGSNNFDIQHPLDQNKRLIHAGIEGPEIAVYYRGEGQLTNGIAIVKLPDYFEALTRKEERTVLLTCKNGWSPLYLDGEIVNNQFIVRKDEGGSLNQQFYWEVKAIRADIEPLIVEKEKEEENIETE